MRDRQDFTKKLNKQYPSQTLTNNRINSNQKMYYLILDCYKDEIQSFLCQKRIEHKFVEVSASNQSNFKYFLLQTQEQLAVWGKTFADRLYDQYRYLQQDQKKDLNLSEWLRIFSRKISAQKTLPNTQLQVISFQQVCNMIKQNTLNVNLINILLMNQIFQKKQKLLSEVRQLRGKAYQTKALIKQAKEQYDEPSNKRIQILVRNLQLRLQSISMKKKVDIQQTAKEKTPIPQVNQKLMKIEDAEQELSRIKSVLKNGMWGCLSKVQQRLEKLQQTKKKCQQL